VTLKAQADVEWQLDELLMEVSGASSCTAAYWYQQLAVTTPKPLAKTPTRWLCGAVRLVPQNVMLPISRNR
jgi:hypothetical protein